MVNPSPVPPKVRLVEVSACWKASKISSCFSRGMPMPVSETAKASTWNEPRRAEELNPLPPAFRLTDSSTRPQEVNLKAFDLRQVEDLPSSSRVRLPCNTLERRARFVFSQS